MGRSDEIRDNERGYSTRRNGFRSEEVGLTGRTLRGVKARERIEEDPTASVHSHGHDLATGLDAVPAPGLLEHARGPGKDGQQSCSGVPGHRSAGARAQGTSLPCSADP